ncbi:2-amino-4-hydroxy-6-hydroxymethyldihydropteridine diphosphokinase [Dictyobacter aurantiacus]|uniref:2-amino-4-hydroxy-6-hydroxymethyldihydropteridine diphosphokinase n=1 Tax=Dictyobacter aurantiacus TaxID=1936993 RepID=A0A401ZJ09_9CHLR|nr:2-amino-4-hydroxy-6-hydroxymethyldihydropteridine diphosphokinase [Dictyobacter aurantiacus]GCE06837.1 2-amino-4-hydroxy-6-hydroxymethyldihydropteridine pyrophosphokinase [Dictyobacter aurantiacus]
MGDESPECSQTHDVYLALGSNLGDRRAHLQEALRRLRAVVDIQQVSTVYETEPVGYLDQPCFFNIVCHGYTNLTPQELLRRAKTIEHQLGRQETIRNGPRPVDIDILFYDTLVYTEENLVIPHPRMHERAFVLVPLAEIAPAMQDPRSGKSVQELLQGVARDGVTGTSVLL